MDNPETDPFKQVMSAESFKHSFCSKNNFVGQKSSSEIISTPSDDTEVVDNRKQNLETEQNQIDIAEMFFCQNKNFGNLKFTGASLKNASLKPNITKVNSSDSTSNFAQPHSHGKLGSWPAPLVLPYL